MKLFVALTTPFLLLLVDGITSHHRIRRGSREIPPRGCLTHHSTSGSSTSKCVLLTMRSQQEFPLLTTRTTTTATISMKVPIRRKLGIMWAQTEQVSSIDNQQHTLIMISELSQLLNDAILLYDRVSSRHPSWLDDQLNSMISYLAQKLQQVKAFQGAPLGYIIDASKQELNDVMTKLIQAKAKEIEIAMIRSVPLKEMELLVEDFRQLQRNEQQQQGQTTSSTTMVQSTMMISTIIVDETSTRNHEKNELLAVRKQLSNMNELADLFEVSNNNNNQNVHSSSHHDERRGEDDKLAQPQLELTMSSNATSVTISVSAKYQDADQLRRIVETKSNTDTTTTVSSNGNDDDEDEQVDIAIVGAGLGGLCAGAILNTLYGKKVGIYESHYIAGGCAHAFDRKASTGVTFTFDSGPSILLGCSSPPYNALRQVLDAIGQHVEWIPYSGWGMIENPGKSTEQRWRVELGSGHFENGPLFQFGGESAVTEFRALQTATKGLLAGASIPAMAMRAGKMALLPLLRYWRALGELIQEGEATTGTFATFMDGPTFNVTSPWLRNWLDALAFSLSGLPASRTAAAAMAFIINDMHRPGAALDYPKGGMGAIVDALVRGVEKGGHGSKVHLRSHVDRIDCNADGTRITGLTLRNGKRIYAREGVICNAPGWCLENLINDVRVKDILSNKKSFIPIKPPSSWTTSNDGSSINLQRQLLSESNQNDSLLMRCSKAEMTGSFLHLHLAINATNMNVNELEAHYTVMDRSLAGDGSIVNGVLDGPCGELNMIAVSNPCAIDPTLAPPGYIVIHAYGAANEPYEIWKGLDRTSLEYDQLKEARAQVLWRAVESIFPNVRDRVVLQMIGSPLTHERFLRRPLGTYGSATEDYLRDGSTPYETLVLASDGVFPGIGVPAVAIAGASAANSFVSIFKQWQCLDKLQKQRILLQNAE